MDSRVKRLIRGADFGWNVYREIVANLEML